VFIRSAWCISSFLKNSQKIKINKYSFNIFFKNKYKVYVVINFQYPTTILILKHCTLVAVSKFSAALMSLSPFKILPCSTGKNTYRVCKLCEIDFTDEKQKEVRENWIPKRIYIHLWSKLCIQSLNKHSVNKVYLTGQNLT